LAIRHSTLEGVIDDPIPPSQLVAIPDIARNLGVVVSTVHKWRHRGVLPEPATIVGGVPIWAWPTILNWAFETHRITLVPVIDKGGHHTGTVARLRGEKVT
jgi:hypothetical protein